MNQEDKKRDRRRIQHKKKNKTCKARSNRTHIWQKNTQNLATGANCEDALLESVHHEATLLQDIAESALLETYHVRAAQ